MQNQAICLYYLITSPQKNKQAKNQKKKKTQTQKQKQKTEHLNVLEKLTTMMGILSRDGLVLVERKQDMAMEDLI